MAGMDSRKLSRRARQPGHDQTFRKSETNFIEALHQILDLNEFAVDEKPMDLLRMLGGAYGIQPEASIEHLPTGRKMFFEVKKQGPAGNADERACKHHTVQFYRELAAFTGYGYHAFCTIMCESLAELPRYTIKHAYFFEPEHYFAWTDYDLDLLADYIAFVCDHFLLHGGAGAQTVPD
jgi:hypothetical protein